MGLPGAPMLPPADLAPADLGPADLGLADLGPAEGEPFPAPVLTSFSSHFDFGRWWFLGHVEYPAPDTVTINFGGALVGHTTRVNFAGDFVYTWFPPEKFWGGGVSAHAVSPTGGSNTLWEWL
jgi:hypothetical protein